MTEKMAVKPRKVSEQIVDILEERILEGRYPVGSKLPPERSLAEEFSVSRPSVRGALRVLSTRGMLEVHHGDGYYVSASLQQDFLLTWQSLIERHEYLGTDVLDFRRSLESTMAALAAERRTDTDLERLAFWLDELEAAYANKQIHAQSEADVGFHQAVAEATHNVLFAQLSGSLLRMLHQHTQQNLANMFGVAKKPELIAQHRAIFEAIKKQQPVKAAKMAGVHLDYVEGCLKTAREQEQRQARSEALAEADWGRSGR